MSALNLLESVRLGRSLRSLFFAVWFSLLASFYLFSSNHYPAPGGDEVIYSVTAHGLATGRGFSRYAMPGPSHYYNIRDYFPPVIPVAMAASYKIFGFGVWQTKFPLWAAAAGAALILFFLLRRMTGDARLAERATAIFMLNSIVGNAFVSGRFESAYIFLAAGSLSLLLGFASLSPKRVFLAFFTAGILTGSAILAYYAYGPISLLLFIIFWWTHIRTSEKPAAIRTGAVVSFGAGLMVIAFFFLEFHLKKRPDLFALQILGQSHTYVGSGLPDLAASVLSEPKRYFAAIRQWLGPADIVFLFGAIFLMLTSNGPTTRFLGLCSVSWLAFLAIYRTKGPQNLAPVFFPAILGYALAWDEARQKPSAARQKFARALFMAVIAFGLIRVTLIGWTVLVQWPSRNYREIESAIRSRIPSDATVIAPQSAWYALAGRTRRVHLYGQDFERTGIQNGAAQLRNPAYARGASHIILDSTAKSQKGLEPLVVFCQQKYERIYQRPKLFKRLPWAKADPYDMEIYRRKEGGL